MATYGDGDGNGNDERRETFRRCLSARAREGAGPIGHCSLTDNGGTDEETGIDHRGRYFPRKAARRRGWSFSRNTTGMCFVHYLLVGGILAEFAAARARHVLDLTPALFERLSSAPPPSRRYFVRLESPNCPDELSREIETGFWRPLARMFGNETFARLSCRDDGGDDGDGGGASLCRTLITEARVDQITYTSRYVDFLTVVQIDRSRRLVELYRGEPNLVELGAYFADALQHPDRPYEPESVETVVQTLQRNRNIAEIGKKVQMSILVLTNDGFTLPHVWQAFLDRAPDGYVRVFVHDKSGLPLNCCTDRGNLVVRVPSLFTQRATISLVRSVLQMLRYAIAAGGSDHYVVVSGDSVPLHSPSDMIRQLPSQGETRFERHLQDYAKIPKDFLRPSGAYASWEKSKSWVLLSDAAAQWYASHGLNETEHWEIVPTADEYYWIQTAEAHNLSWSRGPVMYDAWPREATSRPFHLNQVNDSLASRGHLFARKVRPNTDVDLSWYQSSGSEIADGEL